MAYTINTVWFQISDSKSTERKVGLLKMMVSKTIVFVFVFAKVPSQQKRDIQEKLWWHR